MNCQCFWGCLPSLQDETGPAVGKHLSEEGEKFKHTLIINSCKPGHAELWSWTRHSHVLIKPWQKQWRASIIPWDGISWLLTTHSTPIIQTLPVVDHLRSLDEMSELEVCEKKAFPKWQRGEFERLAWAQHGLHRWECCLGCSEALWLLHYRTCYFAQHTQWECCIIGWIATGRIIAQQIFGSRIAPWHWQRLLCQLAC